MGENKKQTTAQNITEKATAPVTPESAVKEPVYRHQYYLRSRAPIGERTLPFRIERKTPGGRVNLRVVKPGTSKLAQSRASLIIRQTPQVRIKVIGRWAGVARLAEERKAGHERTEVPLEKPNQDEDDAEECVEEGDGDAEETEE
ncbi:hypothetical protein PFICI_13977 [Pestalotiopsis fici W106-1]|uniref:Uncharacterized protein n=1 Tax=Pestalotiopsis fici (strain W106-1 / CGMCC3.15140) TaxID=1229662 RepID=W3WMR6_PESFW|nr:uncharacterized protein PFICI_13977 [Pestalotiopsis fici W106-1]ETS74111.1 hypothetical protein PFICI_13977 [Pestalotiopsis fici W106-1]